MRLDRISELLDPFLEDANGRSQPALSAAKALTANDLQRISTYIDILLRWNARINLTAIRDEEEIVTRHFGESLFAARHLFPYSERVGASSVAGTERSRRDCFSQTSEAQTGLVETHNPPNSHDCQIDRGRAALQGRVEAHGGEGALAHGIANDQRTVADVGSGAGFPGIPIKLWVPEIALTLIESNHKKAIFLQEVTRALTLTDVNILTARAESLAVASFDVVTLRAVERFESILPVAAALVAPGGRLALLIGQSQLLQAKSTLPAPHWSRPLPIPHSGSRVLAIACKPKTYRKTPAHEPSK